MSTVPLGGNFYPKIDSHIEPAVQRHFHLLYGASNDSQQAILVLHERVESLAKSVASSTASSTGITASQAAAIAQNQITTTLGGVNDPSADYTLQSPDYGGVVVMNATSSTTVTLNQRLSARFFTTVANTGTATTTLMPEVGSINGQPSFLLAPNMVVAVNFDGVNWYATAPTYDFTDISGMVAPTQLPTPTVSTLGGVRSSSPVTSEWVSSINASGNAVLSRPTAADIVPASSTTAGRPTGVSVGFMDFDTTLGIPIWWSGAAWVNASGAAV